MFFDSLWSLALTIPATILVGAVLWQAWCNYRATNESYGEHDLLARSSRFISPKRYMAFAALLLIGLALACIGIARPKHVSDTAQFPQGTMDVICISDVSRSMAAQDYLGQTKGEALAGGTRLDMARQIIRDYLIPKLASNRLGIVSFAGEAFDQAYLGDDYKALSWLVENQMKIGSARGEGANVEAALAMALQYMDVDGAKNRHRVIVLFGDGGFDDESPKFAQILAELDKRQVKVLVVGMGGRNPVAIPVAQLGERDKYYMLGSGKPLLVLDGQTQMTSRDDESLKKMAEKLKGKYIRLDQMSDFQLEAEDFELETQTRRSQEDLFRLPITLAFMAIFAGQLCLLAPVFSFKNKKNKENPQ